MAHHGPEREAMVLQYLWLVPLIARKIKARIPDGIDLDDLIGCGTMGLIEAVDRYDDSRAVPFTAFAKVRIRGAIIDSLRSNDWVPVRVRRSAAVLDVAREDFVVRQGRRPTSAELADTIGMEKEEWERFERRARVQELVSLDAPVAEGANRLVKELVPDTETLSAEEVVLKGEDVALAVESINRLPDRERLVLKQYYLEGASLKEMSKEFGLSLSHLSHIKRRAVERLRQRILEQEVLPKAVVPKAGLLPGDLPTKKLSPSKRQLQVLEQLVGFIRSGRTFSRKDVLPNPTPSLGKVFRRLMVALEEADLVEVQGKRGGVYYSFKPYAEEAISRELPRVFADVRRKM